LRRASMLAYRDSGHRRPI